MVLVKDSIVPNIHVLSTMTQYLAKKDLVVPNMLNTMMQQSITVLTVFMHECSNIIILYQLLHHLMDGVNMYIFSCLLLLLHCRCVLILSKLVNYSLFPCSSP